VSEVRPTFLRCRALSERQNLSTLLTSRLAVKEATSLLKADFAAAVLLLCWVLADSVLRVLPRLFLTVVLGVPPAAAAL